MVQGGNDILHAYTVLTVIIADEHDASGCRDAPNTRRGASWEGNMTCWLEASIP
jgi:hypothetical protein